MKILYRPEIDGLRAIAVGVVILYHSQISILGYQFFEGGFIGVDIFFVISGYLITSIILKELTITGSFSFKNFYQRRIRRILPVLLMVMLVSLPFAILFLDYTGNLINVKPSSLLDLSKSILYSMGFSSNFYFHYSGQEYGALDGLYKPFLHTWSLSVEEQYYILFPIVLLIVFKYSRKYLIHTLVFGFFISLGLAEWTSRIYPSISFYFLHTRIWELLAGSILAYFEITKGHRNKLKTMNSLFPFVGLILIAHSVLFFNDEMLHPSFYTLSPIIGVCLIIWFSHKDELITKILSTKLFVGIGLISYSLYLWHYPIFSFYRQMEFVEGNLISQLLILILLIISSILSYKFIEKPYRNKKISFKKITYFLFIKILLITVLCLYSINFKFHPFLTKYANEHKSFELNYNFNNFDKRKNVFIIGNSYADDLLNLLSYNNELNKKYYFYTALADDGVENFQIFCLLDFIEKDDQICDNNSFSFFNTQYEKSDYIIFAERLSDNYLDKNFKTILKFLKKDDKKFVIYLDDLVGANFLLDKYIMEEKKLPNLKTLNDYEKALFKFKTKYKFLNKGTQSFEEILEKIEPEFLKSNIPFIKRSELYCDYVSQKCPLIKNNEKVYSDYGHLTDNGAKYFSLKGNMIMEKLLN